MLDGRVEDYDICIRSGSKDSFLWIHGEKLCSFCRCHLHKLLRTQVASIHLQTQERSRKQP
jgi:hypothetical protein